MNSQTKKKQQTTGWNGHTNWAFSCLYVAAQDIFGNDGLCVDKSMVPWKKKQKILLQKSLKKLFEKNSFQTICFKDAFCTLKMLFFSIDFQHSLKARLRLDGGGKLNHKCHVMDDLNSFFSFSKYISPGLKSHFKSKQLLLKNIDLLGGPLG